MAASKAVTKAQANLPAEIDFGMDEGLGLGDIDKDDIVIPFLNVLQALSPQVDEDNKAEYINGAKPGLIYNTATGSVDKEIIVVPVAYTRRHVEWRPRTEGGGLVQDHGTDKSILEECSKNERGQYITPEGHEIVPAGTFYVLIITEDGPQQAVISMAKTQMKKSKKWVTMLSNERVPRPDGNGKFQPPMFYRSYKLSTVKESNDNGSWYGWTIEKGDTLSELPDAKEIYDFAKGFHKDVTAGNVKVGEEAPEGGSTEEGF